MIKYFQEEKCGSAYIVPHKIDMNFFKKYNHYLWIVIIFLASIIVDIIFKSNWLSFFINLTMFVLMPGLLVKPLICLTRLKTFTSDLKHGAEYLKAIPDAKEIKVSDVFPSNMELSELLNAYYRDNSGFDGDIADYINERILDDVIQKQTTEATISAMTGLGLLGTFIGLILGIKELDVSQEQLMESIRMLMDGMKTAFLTSIFGVVYSLGFNACYKSQYSESIKALDSFYDAFCDKIASNPDNRNMNRLLEYQNKMSESLDALPTAVSTAVAQEISKIFQASIYNANQSLSYQSQIVEKLNTLPSTISASMSDEVNRAITPSISKMENLMEQFVSVATSKQQESLEKIVNSFVDSMNRILNNKFVMLAETLDKTCEMQNRNYEMMNEVVTATTVQLQHLSELNERVENTLENIQTYVSAIETFNSSIMEHNNETHKLIGDVLEAQNNTHTAIQKMEKNITDSTSYVSIVKQTVDELKELLESFNQQSTDIINTGVSVLEKVNKDASEIVSRYSSATKETIDKFSDVSEEFIQKATGKLNTALESFNKQNMENMNANASVLEKANKDAVKAIEYYCSQTTTTINNLDKQILEFSKISGNLITEIRTVGSRIHTECDGLESSLNSSLTATFKVFDENLAEITTHLNSSIREMQELVDRLPRDLYLSIGKLKENMEQCVSLLNDTKTVEAGNKS